MVGNFKIKSVQALSTFLNFPSVRSDKSVTNILALYVL